MRGWGRLVVAITAALIAGAGPTIAQTHKPPTTALAPADAAALRAKIIAFYSAYRDIQMRPGGGIANDAGEPSQDHLFAASTEAIANENSQLLAAAGGGAGDIDADVFTDGNDHGTIHVLSVSFQPRPDGRVASLVAFSDTARTEHNHRKTIIWERTPAGWRVYDVMLSGQDTYRNVMLAENRRLRAEAKPKPPAGRSTARSRISARQAPPAPPPPPPDPDAQALRAGTFRFTGEGASCVLFWSQDATVERNQLANAARSHEMREALRRWACPSDLAYYYLGLSYAWEHDAPTAKAYLEQAIAVAKGKGTPAMLICRKTKTCGYPVSVAADTALRQVNGVISGALVWGDAPQPPPVPGPGQAPGAPSAYAGYMQQPVYTITVTGRNRLLAVRGEACDAAAQLRRGYCFSEAIGQLQANPGLRDTTVVTVDQPLAAGTWVSSKAGLPFGLFKVSRAGAGFRADNEAAYNTHAAAPMGCNPGLETDSGWVIVQDGGATRAAEAARYVCDRPFETGNGIAPVQTTLQQVMAGG